MRRPEPARANLDRMSVPTAGRSRGRQWFPARARPAIAARGFEHFFPTCILLCLEKQILAIQVAKGATRLPSQAPLAYRMTVFPHTLGGTALCLPRPPLC